MQKLVNETDKRQIEGEVVADSGALREWRRQVRSGERTRYDAGLLTQAACAEAHAVEWLWYPPAANEYRRQAREIMRMLYPEKVVATTLAPFAKLLPTHYARRLV